MWIDLDLVERTDCETCGPSYDSLEVEFGSEGLWEARLTTGCTGGGGFDGDRAGVIEWLRENCSDLTTHLDEVIALLESA